jgi:hypothetical protein
VLLKKYIMAPHRDGGLVRALRFYLTTLILSSAAAMSNESLQSHGGNSDHHDCKFFLPMLNMGQWIPGQVTVGPDGHSATPTVPTNSDGTQIASVIVTTGARNINGTWQALTGTSTL